MAETVLGTFRPSAADPWDRAKAAHLLGRAGFGGTPDDIARLAWMRFEDAVEELLEYERISDEPFPEVDFSEVRELAQALADLRRGGGAAEREMREASQQLRRANVQKFQESRAGVYRLDVCRERVRVPPQPARRRDENVPGPHGDLRRDRRHRDPLCAARRRPPSPAEAVRILCVSGAGRTCDRRAGRHLPPQRLECAGSAARPLSLGAVLLAEDGAGAGQEPGGARRRRGPGPGRR